MAATLSATRPMGLDRDLGSLAEGKLADVIATWQNPLKDVAALFTPSSRHIPVALASEAPNWNRARMQILACCLLILAGALLPAAIGSPGQIRRPAGAIDDVASAAGRRLEPEIAGYAKIPCSAIFITGRSLETAADEEGFFVAPLEGRRDPSSARLGARSA